MKRRTVWTFVSIVLIVSVVCFSAMAAYGRQGRRPKSGLSGMRLLSMAEKLDLSEQQVQKIKKLGLETQKEVIQLRADVRIAELELRSLLDQSSVDKKAVHKKIEAIGALRTQIRTLLVDQRIEIKNTLTPEQQEKAKKWRAKRFEDRKRKALDRGKYRFEGRPKGDFPPSPPK